MNNIVVVLLLRLAEPQTKLTKQPRGLEQKSGFVRRLRGATENDVGFANSGSKGCWRGGSGVGSWRGLQT
jgi:hypothetical protein